MLPPADKIQPSSQFPCYQLDPLQDLRWAAFVEKHPRASVFHTVAWLQALHDTYGYKPLAFTTSPPSDDLKTGIAFCLIDSWLTGRRVVSLPFSDHCEPLCDSSEDLNSLIRFLQNSLVLQEWKYLQIRPLRTRFDQPGTVIGFQPADEYYFHSLDLSLSQEEIFKSFDRDSVQRRIERAERGGLSEKCGRSEEVLADFYNLFLITRRRQRVPPTPHAWFQNLIDEMGEALEIRVAYKDDNPVAAILTLQFKNITYYKYGCSDSRFNNYGATPWLFWKAITSAKSRGATQFDLGRTERNNPGLLGFKNQWAPNPRKLIYWRYPQPSLPKSSSDRKKNFAKEVFARVPGSWQVAIGKFLYPHVG
jgi:hypothetical protein